MKLSILAVCWLFTELSVHVSADYVVEVTVQSYDNPTNGAGEFLSSANECCDQNIEGTNNDGVCTGEEQCDNYFRYCLRSLNTLIEERTCDTFARTSNTILNGGDINFSQSPVLRLPNPFTLPGLSRTWQGAQLYVEVIDNDRVNGFANSDDLIDTFSVPFFPPIETSVEFNRVGRFGLATLNGSVRVQCANLFSGEYCNCRSNSCSGGGECVSEVDGFTCNCDPQFTGNNCQLTNFCYQQDCSDRGTCQNVFFNTYICNCDPGYTGRDCEMNIDDCVGVNCMFGGTCWDLVNDYRCDCLPGYTGRNCQTNINDCITGRCSFHGTCRDLVDNYECDCFDGFTGRDCEENIDECVSVSCNGRGMCRDLVNNYTCFCQEDSGYTGRDCELDIDECSLIPSVCNNRGNCSNTVGSFTCSCQPGFTGQNCEIDINDCEEITCNDQGSCTDRVNGFECECFPGFTGMDCGVNIDDCVGQECSGNGQCNDLVYTFECDCLPGFTGDFCETNIDDCANVNCTNGQCVDGIDSFSCTCEPGFTGQLCNVLEVRAAPGGLIGGVVAGLLVLVLLIALLLVVIAVLVKWRAQRKNIADTGAVMGTHYIPGDNPTYEANSTNTAINDGRAINGGTTGNGVSTIRSETAEFDNPIYGSQQSLNDKELSNPIYGDPAFEGPQYKTPYRAVYDTPHGAVYDTPHGAVDETPAVHVYASLEQPYQNVN